jgi:hypothetical protein
MEEHQIIHDLTEALLVAVTTFCPKGIPTKVEYQALVQMKQALVIAKAYLVQHT